MNNILNIGSYDNNFNFIAENIIYWAQVNNIEIIIEYIIKNGFNSLIKNIINNDLIQFQIPHPQYQDNSIRIEAKIKKILEGKNSTFEISDKFKAFIIIYF